MAQRDGSEAKGKYGAKRGEQCDADLTVPAMTSRAAAPDTDDGPTYRLIRQLFTLPWPSSWDMAYNATPIRALGGPSLGA